MQRFNLDSPTYKSLSKEVRDLCRTLIDPEEEWDTSYLREAILYAAALFDPELDLPEEKTLFNEQNLESALVKWRSFGPGRKFYVNKVEGQTGLYHSTDSLVDLGAIGDAEVGFFRGIQTLKSRYGYKETMISLIQFQFELHWPPGDSDYAWGDLWFWHNSVRNPNPSVVLTQSVAKASLLTLNCQPCETVGLLSQSGFSFPLLLEALSQGYTCDLPWGYDGETTVILLFLAELIGKPIDRIQRSNEAEGISAEGLVLKSPDPFIQKVDDISTDLSSGKPRFEHRLEQKLPRWSQHLKRYLIFPPFSVFNEGISSGYFNFAPSLKESADWIENLLESIEPDRRYCFFLNYRFLEAPQSWLSTLRKKMVENQNLDLVIKLPENAFGSELRGCLLVLDGGTVQEPTFIDASDCLTLPEEGSEGLFDDGQFQKILEGPEGPRKAIGINRESWPQEGFSLNVGIHLSATPIPTLPDTTLRLLGDLVKTASSSVDPNAKHFKVAKPEDLNGLDTLTQSSFGNLEILPFDKLRNPDSMKQVENGSLIVLTDLSPHIRAAYYVRSGQGEPGLLIKSNMVTLLPDHSKVNPEWLLHALDTDWALEHLNNRANSSGYGRFIWMRDLLTIPVLLPSLSDQAAALNRLKRERFGLLSENEKLERDLITRRKREKLFLRARTHTMAQQFNGLKSDLSVLRKALKRHGQLDASAKPIPQDPTSVSQLIDLIYSECLELGEGIRRISEPTLSHPRKEFILEEEVRAWVSHQKYSEVDIIYIPPRPQFNAEENDATPITISSSSPDDLNTILTNFVENAIRHGFRDPAVAQKKVEISLVYESTIEDGQFVILRVANNGTPLPDSFTLEHFTAPGLATGKTGNSGLGGWIIQELVNEARAELTICNANLLLKEDLTTGFEIKFNFH